MRLGSTPGLGRLLAALPASDATVRRLFGQIGLRDAVSRGRVSPEAIGAYAALLNHTPTMRHELALGRAVVSPRRGVDPRLALTDDERRVVDHPVLVAWGTADPFGGLGMAREFVAGLPDARLVELPHAGHAPWMDDAAGIGALVDGFLGG
jgi:pimeloyl-ACP methyl ester carboxylesterase